LREFKDDIKAAKKKKKKSEASKVATQSEAPAQDAGVPSAEKSKDTPAPARTAAVAPSFRIEGLHLRILPLFWVVLAIIALQVFAAVAVDELAHYIPMPGRLHYKWMSDAYDGLGLVAVVSLIILALRWRPADFGLDLPKGKWYLVSAVAGGILLGVVAASLEFQGKLVSQIAPHWQVRFPSATNIAGLIAVQGLVVGPSQELFLRGLLSTYLRKRVLGQISLGRFELSVASFLVALFVALSYVLNFVAYSSLLTTGTILYIFVSGLLFAYWFEKSKSLLAPVVGHSLAGVVEYGLIFLLLALQR
jgi:hypothetical protein